MSKINLQPTEEMIKAGIAELEQSGLIDLHYLEQEEESLEDLVVFMWQAMASKLNK